MFFKVILRFKIIFHRTLGLIMITITIGIVRNKS